MSFKNPKGRDFVFHTTNATIDARREHDEYTTKKLIALAQEIDVLRRHLQYIVEYSAGWDEKGSTGPKPPHSWETVGRVALDLAKAALEARIVQ